MAIYTFINVTKGNDRYFTLGNVKTNEFSKGPGESFTIAIDFSGSLSATTPSEVMARVDVTDSGGTSKNTTIISGVTWTSSGLLTVGLKGGDTNELYTLVSRVSDSNILPSGTSAIYSGKLYMRNEDRRNT